MSVKKLQNGFDWGVRLKRDLLFYRAYENFYNMASSSECFQKYCREAYGEDFSQDGFSDLNQINLIFENIPKTDDFHMLDVGCGNGKMLRYLQNQAGGHISGFDYSENAIETARRMHPYRSDFRVGVIGEIDYPMQSFDLIISMDTLYFAKDMSAFIGQIRKWLKKDGVFFAGYEEGELMPKTEDAATTVLARALQENGFQFDVLDYTENTYCMLKHKRETILKFKNEFRKEKMCSWYWVILHQTNSATGSYAKFSKENARYIFIAKLS